MKKIIVVIVFLGVYFAALILKDIANKNQSTDAPPTISNIRAEKGTPVEVEKAKKDTFRSYLRISGFVNKSGVMTTEVTRDVINSIQTGEKATIEFQGKNYIGKISSKSNTTNLLTGLYTISVTFEGVPVDIIGNIVVAHVPLKTLNNVLMIPRRSVSLREKEPFVYVVNDENKLVKRVVKISQSSSESYVISMGVSEGDIIIVSDQRYLKAGEKVFFKN